MKQARATISCLNLRCPYCSASLPAPGTGDRDWDSDDCCIAIEVGRIHCFAEFGGCGEDSAIPPEVELHAAGQL